MSIRNGLTEKEAGYLGYLASKETLDKKYAKYVEEYNKSPKLCVNCNKPISYKKRNNLFCSSSCAATFNNLKRGKSIENRYKMSLAHGGTGLKYLCRNCGKLLNDNDKIFCSDECKQKYFETHKPAKQSITLDDSARIVEVGICPVCGGEVHNKNAKYCSLKCFGEAKWVAMMRQIEENGSFPFNERLNETDRRVVRRYLEQKYGHKCTICGRTTWNDQDIPLIVDHIDGNATNHKVENFRLVCPNCDALLDTFKNRGNRHSERIWRKDYYSKK